MEKLFDLSADALRQHFVNPVCISLEEQGADEEGQFLIINFKHTSKRSFYEVNGCSRSQVFRNMYYSFAEVLLNKQFRIPFCKRICDSLLKLQEKKVVDGKKEHLERKVVVQTLELLRLWEKEHKQTIVSELKSL